MKYVTGNAESLDEPLDIRSSILRIPIKWCHFVRIVDDGRNTHPNMSKTQPSSKLTRLYIHNQQGSTTGF
jgi:hypothetical protein